MVIKTKSVTKKTMTEVIVGTWFMPEGFKLYCCDISNKMFGANLILCFGDMKEFARYVLEVEDYTVTDPEGTIAMYVYLTKKGIRSNYLIFTENQWCAKDYGTLTHELHHFTHFFLDSRGLNYGIGGEELFAYFQGYYMELVVRALIELNKALDKKYKRMKK